MVLGLERAIDLIELVEEEQDQQAPPPQSSPHPGHRASGGTPQNCQNTEDDEELLAGGEEGSNDLSKVHRREPSPGKASRISLNSSTECFWKFLISFG